MEGCRESRLLASASDIVLIAMALWTVADSTPTTRVHRLCAKRRHQLLPTCSLCRHHKASPRHNTFAHRPLRDRLIRTSWTGEVSSASASLALPGGRHRSTLPSVKSPARAPIIVVHSRYRRRWFHRRATSRLLDLARLVRGSHRVVRRRWVARGWLADRDQGFPAAQETLRTRHELQVMAIELQNE
jgi:hypothetical protein